MPKIVLKFDKITGEAKIEVMEAKGPACKNITKFLRDTLGDMTDFHTKAEYYEIEEGKILLTNLCG